MMPAEREAAIRAAVDALVNVLMAAVTPPPADAPDRLLSIPAAADLMSIGRTRLYAELDAGRLRAVRAGRRVLIPASAIGEWIAAQSSGRPVSQPATVSSPASPSPAALPAGLGRHGRRSAA